MIKVLAIVPYSGLREILLEIASNLVRDDEADRLDLHVEVADLQEAIPAAEQAELHGFDVILSRGGTARLIRRYTPLPVVEIPVSGYDILRLLLLIHDREGRTAVVGFPNICAGIKDIAHLLDFKVSVYPITEERDAADLILQAVKDGATRIAGDQIAVKTAAEAGYGGILITSGKESILHALEEIRRVYRVYAGGQERIRFFRTILDGDDRGILTLDQRRVILYANAAAGRMLSEGNSLEGQSLLFVSPALNQWLNSRGEKVKQSIWLNDVRVQITVSQQGLETGYPTIYMERMPELGVDPSLPIHSTDRVKSFNQIRGLSDERMKMAAKAAKYARTHKNIWLSGERGCGKSLLAEAIHKESDRSGQSFHVIHCDELSEEQWDRILKGSGHQPGITRLIGQGTVLLKHADQLSIRMRKQMMNVMAVADARFIFSSVIPLNKLKKYYSEMDRFFHSVPLSLEVPPLRERKDDIPEMIKDVITQFNNEYGRQIVGLCEEIYDVFYQYDWPGNVLELIHTVQELLVLTKGQTTGMDEAEEVLARLKDSGENTGSDVAHLDLSGSWEEIERRILLRVLREEEMNQSRACRRLGINRTTLWRKLKDVKI